MGSLSLLIELIDIPPLPQKEQVVVRGRVGVWAMAISAMFPAQGDVSFLFQKRKATLRYPLFPGEPRCKGPRPLDPSISRSSFGPVKGAQT